MIRRHNHNSSKQPNLQPLPEPTCHGFEAGRSDYRHGWFVANDSLAPGACPPRALARGNAPKPPSLGQAGAQLRATLTDKFAVCRGGERKTCIRVDRLIMLSPPAPHA